MSASLDSGLVAEMGAAHQHAAGLFCESHSLSLGRCAQGRDRFLKSGDPGSHLQPHPWETSARSVTKGLSVKWGVIIQVLSPFCEALSTGNWSFLYLGVFHGRHTSSHLQPLCVTVLKANSLTSERGFCHQNN